MSPTETKERAHKLIDHIPPGQVPVVIELLEKMLDPVSLALANAPVEDEQISEEEEQAAARARSRGYVASPDSHKELLKELGLTVEDFERMAREPLEAEDSGQRG